MIYLFKIDHYIVVFYQFVSIRFTFENTKEKIEQKIDINEVSLHYVFF
jgi:hypothetical protein